MTIAPWNIEWEDDGYDGDYMKELPSDDEADEGWDIFRGDRKTDWTTEDDVESLERKKSSVFEAEDDRN